MTYKAKLSKNESLNYSLKCEGSISIFCYRPDWVSAIEPLQYLESNKKLTKTRVSQLPSLSSYRWWIRIWYHFKNKGLLSFSHVIYFAMKESSIRTQLPQRSKGLIALCQTNGKSVLCYAQYRFYISFRKVPRAVPSRFRREGPGKRVGTLSCLK